MHTAISLIAAATGTPVASSGGGPSLVLLLALYGFLFVVLPGMGALLSATVLAQQDRYVVTIVSTLAAIPFVGYELLDRYDEATLFFGGALVVGAYLGVAVALLVRGQRDDDDRLVVGGTLLWGLLLVVVALAGGYVRL